MFSNTVNESNLFTVYAGCLDVYSSRSSQVKLDWRNIGRLEKAFPVYHWTHDLRVTVMILANTDNVGQHKTDCHWAVCALVFRLDYSEQQCLPYGESIISRGDAFAELILELIHIPFFASHLSSSVRSISLIQKCCNLYLTIEQLLDKEYKT